MIEWNWVAQGAALLVLVRMVCFGNLMKHGKVPQRCILGTGALAVGALAVMFAPVIDGVDFSWPTALFSAAGALFVWSDRRGPERRLQA